MSLPADPTSSRDAAFSQIINLSIDLEKELRSQGAPSTDEKIENILIRSFEKDAESHFISKKMGRFSRLWDTVKSFFSGPKRVVKLYDLRANFVYLQNLFASAQGTLQLTSTQKAELSHLFKNDPNLAISSLVSRLNSLVKPITLAAKDKEKLTEMIQNINKHAEKLTSQLQKEKQTKINATLLPAVEQLYKNIDECRAVHELNEHQNHLEALQKAIRDPTLTQLKQAIDTGLQRIAKKKSELEKQSDKAAPLRERFLNTFKENVYEIREILEPSQAVTQDTLLQIIKAKCATLDKTGYLVIANSRDPVKKDNTFSIVTYKTPEPQLVLRSRPALSTIHKVTLNLDGTLELTPSLDSKKTFATSGELLTHLKTTYEEALKPAFQKRLAPCEEKIAEFRMQFQKVHQEVLTPWNQNEVPDTTLKNLSLIQKKLSRLKGDITKYYNKHIDIFWTPPSVTREIESLQTTVQKKMEVMYALQEALTALPKVATFSDLQGTIYKKFETALFQAAGHLSLEEYNTLMTSWKEVSREQCNRLFPQFVREDIAKAIEDIKTTPNKTVEQKSVMVGALIEMLRIYTEQVDRKLYPSLHSESQAAIKSLERLQHELERESTEEPSTAKNSTISQSNVSNQGGVLVNAQTGATVTVTIGSDTLSSKAKETSSKANRVFNSKITRLAAGIALQYGVSWLTGIPLGLLYQIPGMLAQLTTLSTASDLSDSIADTLSLPPSVAFAMSVGIQGALGTGVGHLLSPYIGAMITGVEYGQAIMGAPGQVAQAAMNAPQQVVNVVSSAQNSALNSLASMRSYWSARLATLPSAALGSQQGSPVTLLTASSSGVPFGPAVSMAQEASAFGPLFSAESGGEPITVTAAQLLRLRQAEQRVEQIIEAIPQSPDGSWATLSGELLRSLILPIAMNLLSHQLSPPPLSISSKVVDLPTF
ncbi:MAG: hypothetical protein JWO53_1142 [Chlamydiia bacterium]|nr:hypothetical protein [Chlamydiia bacterium]